MLYTCKRTGFSFELPEGWIELIPYSIVTFQGPQGQLGEFFQIIQMSFGRILPQYVSPESRRTFLAEPGAEVLPGCIGEEKNVVVLRTQNSSEISIVRDGVQYTILHSNDPATMEAIEVLSRFAKFPTFRQASNAIAHWSAIADLPALKGARSRAGGEVGRLLDPPGVPLRTLVDGISFRIVDGRDCTRRTNSCDWQEEIRALNESTQKRILDKLDRGGDDACAAEQELVALGDEAIDDILQSIAEINGRMNGTIRGGTTDPIGQMAHLERRVKVIARTRSPMAIKALFDALADSALAVESYTNQRDLALARGDFIQSTMAVVHIDAACSLNAAATSALIAMGAQVLTQAHYYMSCSDPVVCRALQKVITRLEPKWWQFWKRG